MAAPKSRDQVKISLDQEGYSDLKDGGTQKTVVIQLPKGGDREGTLREVEKKLKTKFGARYNPSGGSSSVGRTELSGQYYIECKIKGGGGSGAGSDITKLAESAQCVYNAACYSNKPYTHAALRGANSKYDVDEKIDNVLKKLPDDWIDSSKMIAATLKKKFPKTTYKHHRGSTWVNRLYAHYRELNKEAGKPFGDENKWNPADIWMVTPAGESALQSLLRTTTLVELNKMLIDHYEKKNIVGVSLKKAVNIVNFKEMNVSKQRPTFKFEKMTSGLRGFFDSGDAYLLFDGGKAQFRKFGTTWQAELKGKNANMGKMSGGPVKALVDLVGGPTVTFVPQREIKERTDENIEQFYEWYTACPDTPKMEYYDLDKEVMKKDMNWYVSKILSAQIVAIVSAFDAKKKDRFASGLVNYAGSESELSGPYAKVY
mgnify:CR=1 FL=1